MIGFVVMAEDQTFLDYKHRWQVDIKKAVVHPIFSIAAIDFYATQNGWAKRPAWMYPAIRGPRGGVKILGDALPFSNPKIIRDRRGRGRNENDRSYLQGHPQIKNVSCYAGDNFANFIEKFAYLFGIQEEKIGWRWAK